MAAVVSLNAGDLLHALVEDNFCKIE